MMIIACSPASTKFENGRVCVVQPNHWIAVQKMHGIFWIHLDGIRYPCIDETICADAVM